MPEINNIPTTQYIGPKIIPHLADPIDWDITKQYDSLSIVQHEGDTYIARYIVPAGTAITNETYWTKFAAWNAQIAQYQATVETFDGRITDNADDIAAETSARTSADTTLQNAITSEATARTAADSTLQDNITAEAAARTTADINLREAISDEETARINADASLQGSIDTIEDMLPSYAFSNVNTVKAAIDSVASDLTDAEDAIEDINTYINDTLDLGADISFESGIVENKFIYEIFTFPKDKYRIDFKPTVPSALVPGVAQTAELTVSDYALKEKPFFAFNVNPTGNFIYNGVLYGSDWSGGETGRTGFYGSTANGEIKWGRGGSFVNFANTNNCVSAIPAWQPLIINYQPQTVADYSTFTEPNPYPFVAEDDDNLYVCMTFCRFGQFVGMTFVEYQNFFRARNWPNVYVFDGGGSNQMVAGNPFMKFHITVGEISYVDRKEKMVCVISKREV